MDYKTTKFTNRLQKTTNIGQTTKFINRLQSLLIDYKRLQNIGYTTKFTNRLQMTTKHRTHYKVYQ